MNANDKDKKNASIAYEADRFNARMADISDSIHKLSLKYPDDYDVGSLKEKFMLFFQPENPPASGHR